jgi:hypothetical protein
MVPHARKRRAGIEQHIVSEAKLAKWDREMIAHCLECEDLINTSHAVNCVYEATGGWPCLMSQFMKRALAWHKETQNPDVSGWRRSLKRIFWTTRVVCAIVSSLALV